MSPRKLLCSAVLVLIVLPSLALAQSPFFITKTPITGNSGNSFFVFLPMENAGSGDAINIRLRSVSLTYLGRSAGNVTQPPTMPFMVGFAAPTGVHVLDLEFDNSELIAGNRYMLTVNGDYEANGIVYGFQLNRPIIYAQGFSATKNQVLSIIDSKLDALPNIDPTADDEVLLAFLKGLPQVSEAGSQVDPDLVWVDFKDGSQRLHILNNIKFPPRPAVPAAVPKLVSQNQAGLGRVLASSQSNTPNSLFTMLPANGSPELPSTKQIRILNELDPNLEDPTVDIRSWLELNGYKQAKGADGSIVGLRAVEGDGVLYISSHGGISKNDESFFIVSSDPELTYCDPNDKTFGQTPCPDDLLPADIKNGRVIATKARNHLDPKTNKIVSHGNFAITKDFVEEYWGFFANNALVYIDACHSDQNDPNVQAFKDVVFGKKASLYIGWSDSVGVSASSDTARLVFERLLGANRFCPEDGAEECSQGPAEPPVFAQRPFDYTQVAIDLPKHGLGSDTDPIAVLRFERNTGNFGLLAPSISNMSVDEFSGQSGQLTINGVFGTDPRLPPGSDNDGIVTIGGPDSPAKIESWDVNKIVVDLSLSGPGSSGDVQVIVRGHKSNLARLTEWKGQQFLYTVAGNGSLQITATFNLHFRLDIRKYRKQIHIEPIEPTGGTLAATDSSGTFSAGGSGPGIDQTFEWSGSGNLVYFTPTIPLTGLNIFGATMLMIDSTHLQNFVGASSEANAGGVCTVISGSPPVQVQGPLVIEGPGNLGVFVGLTNPQEYPFKLDPDTADILQDMFVTSGVAPVTAYNCMYEEAVARYTYKWGPVPATSDTAPDPKSAR